MSELWVGHGRHPLCSRECAAAYVDDRYDVDLVDGEYAQCSGFIDDGYVPADFELGEKCAICGKDMRT